MFDLTQMDVFRESDVILTVKTGHDPNKVLETLGQLNKAGLEVYAFSDRGDHKQYLLVPDIEVLRERNLESCRNSLAGVFDGAAKSTVP